jgi:hypothetical protein
VTTIDIGLSVACGVEFFWMALLTVAYVRQRQFLDRVTDRMAGLAKRVNQTSRMRHNTGSQPAVTGTQTRLRAPPPPFPIDPPSTNPIQPAPGRHSSP